VLHVLRRLSSVLAATAVAVTAFAIAAPAANASTEESQFVSLTNSARAGNGLRSYSVASDLVSVARRHAQEMASKHSIYHNDSLRYQVSGWEMIGENVGMGGSASSIHQAFMDSTAHKANILDHDFTQVGMGTAYDDRGVLYITQVFRKPAGSTATAPAPAPRPVYTTAPKPVYKPVARTTTAPVAKPAAKPVAKPALTRADPRAALRKRLAAASKLAAGAPQRGSLGQAMTYVEVMRALA
jgi:hypothetical protein